MSYFLYKVQVHVENNFFFCMNDKLFQHCLLKRLSFFHWIAFVPLPKTNRPYLCASISGLCSVPLLCGSDPSTNPTLLITAALQKVRKSSWGNASGFIPFRNHSGFPSSFAFLYDFYNKLVYTDKKSCWDFHWNYVKFIDQFEEMWLLCYVESCNPSAW